MYFFLYRKLEASLGVAFLAWAESAYVDKKGDMKLLILKVDQWFDPKQTELNARKRKI